MSWSFAEIKASKPNDHLYLLIWFLLQLVIVPCGSFEVSKPKKLQRRLSDGHVEEGGVVTTRSFMTSERISSFSSVSDTTTSLKQRHEQIMERSVHDFMDKFQSAWNSDDSQNVLGLFLGEDDDDSSTTNTPFWRDMVAFSWNICTMEGKSPIQEGLDHVFENRPRHEKSEESITAITTTWQVSNKPTPINVIQDRIEFWCDLTIPNLGTGKAHFRVKMGGGSGGDVSTWKIQTLLTTLLELEERPFQVGHNRIRGAIHGPTPNRRYWDERLEERHSPKSGRSGGGEDEEDGSYPVVIIGGGQAGLALAARLQLMDVPYVVLEAGTQPGMAWRKRYPSLHLHDPVWYNHMPYLPFPETWPVLCPRDKIADWMEFYAKVLDLNVQTNHRVESVERDNGDGNGKWKVNVQEKTGSGGGSDDARVATTKKTIRARHVVFATGNSSHPRVPNFPGTFRGTQLHSSEYRGGRCFANKRVVVVGSNNSGFDIVQDLWEQGAKSVTMLQRSPSLVVSTDSVLNQGLGPLYHQDAPLHHEEADLVATTLPYKLLLPRWTSVTSTMREVDADLHQGLIDAGYKMDFGPDGTGLFAKSATEGGGFYINMGCAELFIRGDATVRYATVSSLQDDGVVIVDQDTEQEELLSADVIVYATGFDTMDQWVEDLCGEEISKSMGRTWGLGYGRRPKDPGPWEGELRNMWKPTTVDGLWFHGGNLAQSRHYSRFLALQLTARYLGMDTPVHGIPNPTPPAKQ